MESVFVHECDDGFDESSSIIRTRGYIAPSGTGGTLIIEVPTTNRYPGLKRVGLESREIFVYGFLVSVHGFYLKAARVYGRECEIEMCQAVRLDLFGTNAVTLALADVSHLVVGDRAIILGAASAGRGFFRFARSKTFLAWCIWVWRVAELGVHLPKRQKVANLHEEG